jgi:hypothetical protein
LGHRHVIVSYEYGSVSFIREFPNGSLIEAFISVDLIIRFSTFKKFLWNVGLRVNILDTSVKSNAVFAMIKEEIRCTFS